MNDDAKKALKKSKEIGHKSDQIDRLGSWLSLGIKDQSVVSAVEELYEIAKT